MTAGDRGIPPASGFQLPTRSIAARQQCGRLAPLLTTRQRHGALPAPAAVADLLEIDPRTGAPRWRVKPANRIMPGSRAGHRKPNGRVRIGFLGAKYPADVLQFVIRFGAWPAWRQ